MLITAFCEFFVSISDVVAQTERLFCFVLEFHQLEGTNSAATMEKIPLFPHLWFIFMRLFDDVTEVG